LGLNPRGALEGKKRPQLGFASSKKCCPELDEASLQIFMNTNVVQDATVRSSIAASEVFRHIVKYIRIMLKPEILCACLAHTVECIHSKYYCNSSSKSKVFNHGKNSKKVSRNNCNTVGQLETAILLTKPEVHVQKYDRYYEIPMTILGSLTMASSKKASWPFQ